MVEKRWCKLVTFLSLYIFIYVRWWSNHMVLRCFNLSWMLFETISPNLNYIRYMVEWIENIYSFLVWNGILVGFRTFYTRFIVDLLQLLCNSSRKIITKTDKISHMIKLFWYFKYYVLNEICLFSLRRSYRDIIQSLFLLCYGNLLRKNSFILDLSCPKMY